MELVEDLVKSSNEKISPSYIRVTNRTKARIWTPGFPALCPFCNSILTLRREDSSSNSLIILLLKIWAFNLEEWQGREWCHSWPEKSDKIYKTFSSVSQFQSNYFYGEFFTLKSIACMSECGRHPRSSLPQNSWAVHTSWFPL